MFLNQKGKKGTTFRILEKKDEDIETTPDGDRFLSFLRDKTNTGKDFHTAS